MKPFSSLLVYFAYVTQQIRLPRYWPRYNILSIESKVCWGDKMAVVLSKHFKRQDERDCHWRVSCPRSIDANSVLQVPFWGLPNIQLWGLIMWLWRRSDQLSRSIFVMWPVALSLFLQSLKQLHDNWHYQLQFTSRFLRLRVFFLVRFNTTAST